ncbi:MAG: hypothetical protein ACYC6J_10145, partial [Coriobacteriia bacterium]
QKSKPEAVNKQKEIESLAKTKVNESNQIQQEKRNQQILEEQAKVFEPTEPINQFPKTGVVAEYEKATGTPIKQVEKKEQQKTKETLSGLFSENDRKTLLKNETEAVKLINERILDLGFKTGESIPLLDFVEITAPNNKKIKLGLNRFDIDTSIKLLNRFVNENKKVEGLIDGKNTDELYEYISKTGDATSIINHQNNISKKYNRPTVDDYNKIAFEKQNIKDKLNEVKGNPQFTRLSDELTSRLKKIEKKEKELSETNYAYQKEFTESLLPLINKSLLDDPNIKDDIKRGKFGDVNSDFIPTDQILINGKPSSFNDIYEITDNIDWAKGITGKNIKFKLDPENKGWIDNERIKKIATRLKKNNESNSFTDFGLSVASSLNNINKSIKDWTVSAIVAKNGGRKVSTNEQEAIEASIEFAPFYFMGTAVSIPNIEKQIESKISETGAGLDVWDLVKQGRTSDAFSSLNKQLASQAPILAYSYAFRKIGLTPLQTSAGVGTLMGVTTASEEIRNQQQRQSELYEKQNKGISLTSEEENELWVSQWALFTNGVAKGAMEGVFEYYTSRMVNKYLKVGKVAGRSSEEMADELTKTLWGSFKGALKDVGEENLTELATLFGQEISQYLTTSNAPTGEELVKKLRETIIQTSYSTLTMTGAGTSINRYSNNKILQRSVQPFVFLTEEQKNTLSNAETVLKDSKTSEVAKNIAKKELESLKKDSKSSFNKFNTLENNEKRKVVELFLESNNIKEELKKEGKTTEEKELLTKEQEKINSEIEIISKKANELVKEKIKSEKEIKKVEVIQPQEVIEGKEDTPSPTKEWNIEKPQAQAVEEISKSDPIISEK